MLDALVLKTKTTVIHEDGSITETETEVRTKGETALSPEAQATFDALIASFEGVDGKIKLKLKVKKHNGEPKIEVKVKKGTLREEQLALRDSIIVQVIALVEAAEDEDAEIRLEFESEHKAAEEEDDEFSEVDEEVDDEDDFDDNFDEEEVDSECDIDDSDDVEDDEDNVDVFVLDGENGVDCVGDDDDDDDSISF